MGYMETHVGKLYTSEIKLSARCDFENDLILDIGLNSKNIVYQFEKGAGIIWASFSKKFNSFSLITFQLHNTYTGCSLNFWELVELGGLFRVEFPRKSYHIMTHTGKYTQVKSNSG